MGNFDHYVYGNFDHYTYGNKVRGAGEACRRQGCLSAHGGGVIWWLARGGREGGEEVGACHTDQEESEAIAHLWGRLAVLIQRGNAAILGNRVPSLPDPLIDGNL